MTVRERARPALRAALAELGLAGIEELAMAPSARTIKQDARSRVTQVGPLRDGTSLVVKAYRELPHLAWRTIGRPGSARREYLALLRIRHANVPAVEPLGWFERRRIGLLAASILVTRLVPSEDLRQALARGEGLTPRGEPLAAVAASLLEGARRLHEAGIFPWTLLDKNVLLPLDPADPNPFYLCDTPKLRIRKGRGQGSARRHDIACMVKWWCKGLAPADCVSLLLAAGGHRTIDRASLRDAARILARVDRMENRTPIARLSTALSRCVRKLFGRRDKRVSTNPKYLQGAARDRAKPLP